MTKPKEPSFQFYPGDWIKDPELSICSATARGVWIDVLCLAWECTPRGYLISNGKAWTLEQAAYAIRGDWQENLAGLKELLKNGVLKQTKRGLFFSQKLTKIDGQRAEWRAKNRLNYLKRREESLARHSPVTTPSSSSSSSSIQREEKRRTSSAKSALDSTPLFPRSKSKATPQQTRYVQVRELINAAKTLWKFNASDGNEYTVADWKEDLKLHAARNGIPYDDRRSGVSSPIDQALEIATKQLEEEAEGKPH